MYRRGQLADVARIDDLALKASGEIAVASILSAKKDGIETLAAAAEYAASNPKAVEDCLRKELYFDWISERITDIRKSLANLEPSRLKPYDEASIETTDIFEAKVSEIDYFLNKEPSGIYPCVNEIFLEDKRLRKYTTDTLLRIKDIKITADEIHKAVWRITHPYFYIIYSRTTLYFIIFAFMCSIPLWYFFGAHGESIQTLPEQSRVLIDEDIRRLREIAQSQELNLFEKIAYFAKFGWEFLLAVPTIFLALAAILAFARRRLSFKGKSLSRYEKLFFELGKQLQSVMAISQKG